MDQHEEESGINEETRAIEEVLNALLYYRKYGQEKVLKSLAQMKTYPADFQRLVANRNKDFVMSMRDKIEHNQRILEIIVNNAEGMVGENHTKAMRIHQVRRPTPDFQSKVLSTIRQICREWSTEGAPERDATFRPVIEELNGIFPNFEGRQNIRILVPGCGLGRLPHDLIQEGYTVQGNEFSYFMLFTSFFILNSCREAEQYTIYPFLFDKSNCWDSEDRLRGVKFPDRTLAAAIASRPNSFSMCAGNFLEIIKDSQFDVIVTAWFLDTANDVFKYIDAIYDGLPENGVWINVGPLTWHFEDIPGEQSLEVPYSDIMLRIRQKGFEVINEKQIESKYTVNRRSMLHHLYNCAYFYARKGSPEEQK